jgi:hypothetical protein
MSGVIFHTHASYLRTLKDQLQMNAIDLDIANKELTESTQVIMSLQSPNEPPEYYRSFNSIILAHAEARSTYLSKRIVAKVNAHLGDIANQSSKLKSGETVCPSDLLDMEIERDLNDLPDLYAEGMRIVGLSVPPLLPDESRSALEKLDQVFHEFKSISLLAGKKQENKNNQKYSFYYKGSCLK